MYERKYRGGERKINKKEEKMSKWDSFDKFVSILRNMLRMIIMGALKVRSKMGK